MTRGAGFAERVGRLDEPATQVMGPDAIDQRAGEKRVTFAETPPLSSYLVALCVGELSSSDRCSASSTRTCGPPLGPAPRI